MAHFSNLMATGNMLDPSSAEHPKERTSLEYHRVAFQERLPSPAGRNRDGRKLILCFDGTGNKFHGDESDSNILKIFRMLDRTADDQYHYYQPGIGTYVISNSLSHTTLRARIRSWYQKAKDSAVGSSFDQHVVGGYRFLMRFYNPGDEIYMFGFSRGAYIARFLAEMLDYVGLLSHGNEELVSFAWKAFSQWQCRHGSGGHEKLAEAEEKKKHEMYHFMKGFRETFSRPVGRIRFLGLFDTVNSVPRFETAWMQRSKFPYTARTSAKVIRHAVSIDERRAKFRQDLMYQHRTKRNKHRPLHEHLGNMFSHIRYDEPNANEGENENTNANENKNETENENENKNENEPRNEGIIDEEKDELDTRGRRPSQMTLGENGASSPDSTQTKYEPYRPRSRSCRQERRRSVLQCNMSEQYSEADPEDEDDGEQDIDEVWFAGGHGDVGGGWQTEGQCKNASHVPLVWMVREAMRAGLPFDLEKVQELDCLDLYGDYGAGSRQSDSRRQSKGPDITLNKGGGDEGEPIGPPSPDLEGDEEDRFRSEFMDLMHGAHLARIHDSLVYGGGLGTMAVTAWNMMEWMPFRRMDLQPDGSWKPINWPLPRGEVRDIPDDVRVHGSVIRRMKMDETYRPGNLIIGGGGRGVRVAPSEYGIGEWVCVDNEGDPIGEVWIRNGKPKKLETNGKKKKKDKKKKSEKNSEETVNGQNGN